MFTHRDVKTSSAFTIVELLIVIVVIAILAAISLVAYNGIQARANASAASSALTQAAKKLSVAMNDGTLTGYPTDQEAFDALDVNSGSTNLQYKPIPNGTSPTGYCITATSGAVSYKLDSTAGANPTPGGCSGHGVGGVAAITNMIVNPSVESDGVGWSLVNGAAISRQAAAAIHGSQGIRVTTSNTADSGTQVGAGTMTVTAGVQYTASLSIRAVTAANYSLSVQGPGGTVSRHTQSLGAGQTSRFNLTWTPTTSGVIAFYGLKQGAQAGSFTFDVDGAMLVRGSSASTYADGGSPGWVWTGATNNSTSTGPPL